MTVSIDFDNTFTADPALWSLVIALFQLRGHQVICTTGRSDTFMRTDTSRHWGDEVRDLFKKYKVDIPIIFAALDSKRRAAKKEGYQVDIWIDDTPESIAGD